MTTGPVSGRGEPASRAWWPTCTSLQRERVTTCCTKESTRPRFLTGNTVVDALRLDAARVAEQLLPPELDPAGRRLVLVTAHRRSFGEPFRELCLAARQIAERFEDICLVYPFT